MIGGDQKQEIIIINLIPGKDNGELGELIDFLEENCWDYKIVPAKK